MEKLKYLITTLIVFAFVTNKLAHALPCDYIHDAGLVKIWSHLTKNENLKIEITGTIDGSAFLDGYDAVFTTYPPEIQVFTDCYPSRNVPLTCKVVTQQPLQCNSPNNTSQTDNNTGGSSSNAGTFKCWYQKQSTGDYVDVNNAINNLGLQRNGTYDIKVFKNGFIDKKAFGVNLSNFDDKRVTHSQFNVGGSDNCDCTFTLVNGTPSGDTNPPQPGSQVTFDCDYIASSNSINLWKSMSDPDAQFDGHYDILATTKSKTESVTLTNIAINDKINSTIKIEGQQSISGGNQTCDCTFTPLGESPPPNTNQPTDPPTNPPSTEEPTFAGDCWYKKSGKLWKCGI